jgi:metal-sulfur cluster biosynthetic enzyme
MPTKEDVIEILKKINDPEINIDIWTLELIYDVKVEDDKVQIKMTFTTPMCPYGPALMQEVKTKVTDIPGVKETDIDITFDPPWKPSEELRATLGV